MARTVPFDHKITSVALGRAEMVTNQSMRTPWLGLAETRLLEQMAKVLDPLAVTYGDTPSFEIKPMIERAWSETFGIGLGEPALSRCAAAISARRPWLLALWNNNGPDVSDI